MGNKRAHGVRAGMGAVVLALLASVTLPTAAHADTWVQGTITDIQYMTAGDSNDKVAIWANVSPSTGCTYSGFFLLATDPYFKEVYSAVLLARATGNQIKFLHSYCHSSGFSRINGFMSLAN
jgi:hypothetical protein